MGVTNGICSLWYRCINWSRHQKCLFQLTHNFICETTWPGQKLLGVSLWQIRFDSFVLHRSYDNLSFALPIYFRYSYNGFLHHNDSNTNGENCCPRVYATQKWEHGTTVGVHLDRWNGTIEFYLDGVPLGTGFQGKLARI